MQTTIVFFNEREFKVTTKRGEVLAGFLTLEPADTEKARRQVAELIAYAFDTSQSLNEGLRTVDTGRVDRLTTGIKLETLVGPAEAHRRRIGASIRALRESKGMSARELAFLTHIDASNLSKIEQGKHAVNLDTLNKIAHILDAQVEIVPLVDDGFPRTRFMQIHDYWD
ncbi:MAG: helix-turn-helix transcriptional regulator [Bacteroidaceae bacterium]|nr:helix-turn-helix transcriptional regulator [Bacteroidaceae bacterium]